MHFYTILSHLNALSTLKKVHLMQCLLKTKKGCETQVQNCCALKQNTYPDTELIYYLVRYQTCSKIALLFSSNKLITNKSRDNCKVLVNFSKVSVNLTVWTNWHFKDKFLCFSGFHLLLSAMLLCTIIFWYSILSSNFIDL